MYTRFSFGRLAAFLAAVLFTAGCQDPVAPAGHTRSLTAATVAPLAPGTGITLDQQNGTLYESGTMLAKGFDPKVFYSVDDLKEAAEGVAPRRLHGLFPGLLGSAPAGLILGAAPARRPAPSREVPRRVTA